MTTEVERAYAAGFVDGEGCITLLRTMDQSWQWDRRQVRRYTNNRRTAFYQPVVIVANTNRSALEWLFGRWNGGLSLQGTREGHKTSWQWRLGSYGAVQQFLAEIRPYLLVKDKQADLMLGWLAESRVLRRHHGEEVRRAFAILNAKGRDVERHPGPPASPPDPQLTLSGL